jgi:fumarylacetoacetase
MIDDTHDPHSRSWVDSANAEGTDFPIQNLPFGVFTRPGHEERPRIGVAIGDQILDLSLCQEARLLEDLSRELQEAVTAPTLNSLMALGHSGIAQLRPRLTRILGADRWGADPKLLIPMDQAQLQLPVAIGDYTDFYASIHHPTNVGRLFRPDSPLLPNYKHLPLA